jgi:pimeloyl-ACP methyl ester carboxylesterase
MGDAVDEARALGHLLGDATAGLARAVRISHTEASALVDAVVPGRLRPWRPVTRATTAGVYAAITLGARTLPVAAAETAVLAGRAERLAPSRSGFGRAFLAAANGLWSPIVDRHPPLVIAMRVRTGVDDLVLTETRIEEAFPDHTRRLVVFVHGMVTDDSSWHRPAPSVGVEGHSTEERATYGHRLRHDAGATAVFVRYNSGRAVETNGRSLAELLEALTDLWPTDVDVVDLVGHSMGGLVAVAAVRHATATSMRWTRRPGLVVTLGTPHHGAPLARIVRSGTRLLTRVPVVGPVVDAVRPRTEGGEDLCEDPGARDPGAPRGAVRVTAVAATRFGTSGHRLLESIGDGMVPTHSAQARSAVALDVDPRHVEGAGHLRLLNHPDVYRALVSLLRR